MTSVVRYKAITNGTGAVLTSALADNGNELASQKVKRTFTAADIGTGAGQTRDASNPTGGCLVAQFNGSRVQSIINLTLMRREAATVTTFDYVIYGEASAATTVTKIGTHVTYNAQTGVSSIYLIDSAAAGAGRIVANDWIEFDVLLGDIVA